MARLGYAGCMRWVGMVLLLVGMTAAVAQGPDAAVLAKAQAGDAAAQAVVRDVSAVLARTVHGLVMAYDLERVVIGGGVARIGAPFLIGIEAALDEFRAKSPLAAEMLPPDVVRLVPPDFDAGCWGAVALAEDAAQATAPVAVAARETEVGA